MPSSPDALSARWRLRQAPEGALARLRGEGLYPDFTCRLLAVRGYGDSASAKAFLTLPLAAAHDPLLLSGMQAAVERLQRAFQSREKVAILGDYDVDGVTSTVLLIKLFALLGMPYEAYIPDRLKEGYGPNTAALLGLKARGAAVAVTVDCGISALPEALAAKAAGLDLIITDHHVPGPQLPEALAVVNPKTSPNYPYDMLGGVGVAYKLASALLTALQHPRKDEFLDHMLELVALGTICDVAPLDGENRALVKEGLKRLRTGRWLGLRSLAEAANVKLEDADAGAVGFYLGPRINAGGRIGDAMLGVQLLLSKDGAESRDLAAKLNAENRERQALEKKVVAEAAELAAVKVAQGAKALVLWSTDWHPGVVGLAASRLLERFQRPTFVFGVQDGLAKGSARARKPFNIVQALQVCAPHLVKFGGHEVAAGATATLAQLPSFAAAFEAQAESLSEEDLRPVLDVDLELGFSELGATVMDQLAIFEPHGMKNPRPSFMTRGAKLRPSSRRVGENGDHLKLDLEHDGKILGGIAFRQGAKLDLLGIGKPVDALYSLSWNVWQGKKTLQLEMKDLRPSGQA